MDAPGQGGRRRVPSASRRPRPRAPNDGNSRPGPATAILSRKYTDGDISGHRTAVGGRRDRTAPRFVFVEQIGASRAGGTVPDPGRRDSGGKPSDVGSGPQRALSGASGGVRRGKAAKERAGKVRRWSRSAEGAGDVVRRGRTGSRRERRGGSPTHGSDRRGRRRWRRGPRGRAPSRGRRPAPETSGSCRRSGGA